MTDTKNSLAEDEDFFIEAMPTDQYPSTTISVEEDIRYFRRCLFEALRVPKEYWDADLREDLERGPGEPKDSGQL